jgi:hypothetical protein
LTSELGTLTPYDPVAKKPALKYDYPSDPAFSKLKLSYYPAWYAPADFDRLAKWRGRPISGRYSFPNDSHDAIETVTNAPSASALPKSGQNFAGSLPHHNEIAVDEAGSHTNAIYTATQYQDQFARRYQLALQHITQVFKAHPALAR